jgi:hypothetical protein
MASIINKSFGINLSVLRILNLYIPTEVTRFNRVLSYITYILFTLHVPILGTLYFLLEDVDIHNLGDSAFTVAQIICFFAKLLPFVTKKEEIKKCIHYLESPIFIPLRENHKEIIDKNANICRRNSIIYLTCISSSLIVWVMKPFFLEDKRLPVDVWFPTRVINNPKIFYCLYIYTFLGQKNFRCSTNNIYYYYLFRSCLSCSGYCCS